MTPTISVRSLTHSFEVNGKLLPVLSGVSMEIQQGSFISVIGPSGCGKTTLLKIIGGLLDAESGSVTIEGAPPLESRRRKLER